MRRTLLTIATAALTACAGPGEDPSYTQTDDAIRNGTREPQVVALTEGQTLALGWMHPAGRPGSNFCSGTIVSPRIVATAKHCVDGRNARGVGFGVGLFPNDPRATFPVAQIWAHPDVDAAVLVLAEDATVQVPELEPIPFNREPLDRALVGTEIEAAGYGQTYDRQRFGRYFAVVELYDFDRTMVHVDGRGQQGICFGDSGGPVMTDQMGELRVLGVESWGDQSCVGRDHLTRLDILADWIDGIEAGEPPEGGCGEIDYQGQCDGTVAEWCDNGQVRRRDCSERGQVCDYVNDEVGFFCTEGDPCEGLNSAGVCRGDEVLRCRFGQLRTEDCPALGQICTTDDGGSFCADPPPPMRPEPPPEADAGAEPDPGPEPADPDAGPEPAEPDAEVADSDSGAGEDGSEKSNPSSGCSTTPGAPSSPFALLLLLGALRGRRRVS